MGTYCNTQYINMQVTQCYLSHILYMVHTHTPPQTHGSDDLLKQWQEKRGSTLHQCWRGGKSWGDEVGRRLGQLVTVILDSV